MALPLPTRFFSPTPDVKFDVSLLLTGSLEEREEARSLFQRLIHSYHFQQMKLDEVREKMLVYQSLCEEYDCKYLAQTIDNEIDRLTWPLTSLPHFYLTC